MRALRRLRPQLSHGCLELWASRCLRKSGEVGYDVRARPLSRRDFLADDGEFARGLVIAGRDDIQIDPGSDGVAGGVPAVPGGDAAGRFKRSNSLPGKRKEFHRGPIRQVVKNDLAILMRVG